MADHSTAGLQRANNPLGRQPPRRWRDKLTDCYQLVCRTLSVAPSGTIPSSTKRHSAIASFLASATMPTFRPRMPLYEETSVKRYFIAKPLFLFSQPA
jgi:hypothetical protein